MESASFVSNRVAKGNRGREKWVRSSTPTSTSTTPTIMWCSLLMWRSSFPRIGSSNKTNGVRSGFSRAVGGSTMRFIAPSHTSCSSGGL